MTPELLDELERLEKESHENSFRMTAYLSKLQDAAPSLIQSLRSLMAENEALKKELERERMRLAACGTAALGYFDGCHEDYKSASLDDVLKLRAENEALKAKMGQKDEGMHPNWYSEDSGGTVYSKAHGDSEVTCRSCKRTFITDPMDAACRLCGNWFSAKRAAQKEGGK